MTREEAIQALKDLADMNVRYGCDDKWIKALNMAIEALSADTVSRFHHDMEVKELKHQIKDQAEMVAVVRCKDCRQYIPHDLTEAYGWCCEFKTPIEEDDFCSRGERSE